MGTRRAAFTQLDVQRAVRGARAAGVSPDELRIAPTGEIRMMFRNRETSSSDTPRDVLDEIEELLGDGKL